MRWLILLPLLGGCSQICDHYPAKWCGVVSQDYGKPVKWNTHIKCQRKGKTMQCSA